MKLLIKKDKTSSLIQLKNNKKGDAACGSKSIHPVFRPVGKGQLSCSRQIVWTADYEHLSTGHTKVSNPRNTVNTHPVGSHSAPHRPDPRMVPQQISHLKWLVCPLVTISLMHEQHQKMNMTCMKLSWF